MTVPARITLVTLGVADVARSTAFYEALGWRRSGASNDDVSFFHTAGPVLAVWGRTSLADDAAVPVAGDGFRGVAVAINMESPEVVDAALAAWVAAGGTVSKAPEHTDWGGYSGYVADPDGHLWEFAHNPGFPLRPDGTVELPQ
jgi:catechol 2,3-dioxygenase-like lactoylglutathione lyase family enzyme